jgi:hypothetical protein
VLRGRNHENETQTCEFFSDVSGVMAAMHVAHLIAPLDV